jgi:hypothetical protein
VGNRVKVVIELNYDVDSFADNLAPMTNEEFMEYVGDELVPEDLSDLMRGDKLKYWAEVTMVDEFGELVATQ